MTIRMLRRVICSMLALAFIHPSLAADLQMKAAPNMFSMAPNWSGCTLGFVGGGAWGSSRHVANSPDPMINGMPITNPFQLSGGLAGGTVGCNYQVNRIVFGLEDDFSWTNLRGTGPDMAPFSTLNSSQTSAKWLDTLRGRAGFTWGHSLLYATGGAAFASSAANICAIATGACVSNARTRTGWVAGAGIEYAMLSNLSLKLEYLHADFGSESYFNTQVALGQVTVITRNVRLTEDIVRAGLNWRFTSFSGMITGGP
jgi:outer membrane immunogenic protein